MDTFLGQGMAIKGPGKSMLLDYPRITINFNIYSSKVKSPPHFFPTNFSLSIISCFPPIFLCWYSIQKFRNHSLSLKIDSPIWFPVHH